MQSFTDRVTIERSALKLVNRSQGDPQLCGLSRAAILQWEAGNRSVRAPIAAILLDLAQGTSSLSERSGNHFSEHESVATANVAEALVALRSQIGEP